MPTATPGYWIWRNYETPYCIDSWGISEVCTENYNIYNAFCCHCTSS
jgi:hypothetical protein